MNWKRWIANSLYVAIGVLAATAVCLADPVPASYAGLLLGPALAFGELAEEHTEDAVLEEEGII